jgi:cysteinyl-tRNA synthetase
VSDLPDEVRALADDRAAARAAKDFATADALRDRIAELGYAVTDGPDGPVLEPLEAPPEAPSRPRAADVPSVLDEPASADVSVQWIVEGWPDDVRRALDAFRANAGDRSMHYVVVDVTSGDGRGFGDDVEVLPLEEGTGWASARNAGLRRSRGRLVLVLDGSVEPTGDVIGPIERALADERVGVAGPFGISSRDLRAFTESDGVGPDRAVDAIEGYMMAFRRDLLATVTGFDERFRWYRTADIELCFRVRDAGLRSVVVDVPVTRHEHRMWATTSPEERDRLSKRNFYRFLDRFRDRADLLVEPGDVEG